MERLKIALLLTFLKSPLSRSVGKESRSEESYWPWRANGGGFLDSQRGYVFRSHITSHPWIRIRFPHQADQNCELCMRVMAREKGWGQSDTETRDPLRNSEFACLLE